MSGVLSGLTVVELETGPAGAIAGMILADNGANVTVVRTTSNPYPVWDRGKTVIAAESWSASLTTIDQLASTIDVILGPPRLNRDWIDRKSPHPTVACLISSYGIDENELTLADPALVAARVGLCGNQPGWAPGPSWPAFPLPAIGAALLVVQGIGAALMNRAERDRPRVVETSLLAGALAMSSRVAGEQIDHRRRWSWRANGPFPFYSMYAAADGQWVQLGCIHQGFVDQAVAALGVTDEVAALGLTGSLAVPTPEIQDRLFDILTRAFAMRPAAEWATVLEAADVPYALVLPSQAYLDDPQAQENGLTTTIDRSDQPRRQVGPAFRFLNAPVQDNPPPSETLPTTASSPSGTGPLAGLRVLELANLIAGPMAGRFLADLGADVIKLEAPDGGDIARRNGTPAFLPLNAGKRGIAVNLRSAEGQEIGRRLAAHADVVIDNMRPGVTERLGMGWQHLSALNPRIVYCQVTAFGSRGPYAHKPGLDPLASALSGMAMAQGDGDRPVYVQSAQVDHTAALLASAGILLALVERERSGRGRRVETSLLDAGALINAPAIADGSELSITSQLTSQYGPSALRRLYQTADGWLALIADADGDRVRLQAAVGNLPPNDDCDLATVLASRFASASTSEWIQCLHEQGIAVAAVDEGDDAAFLEDAALVSGGYVARLDHPEIGGLALHHGWLRFDGVPTVTPGPPPLLGEHLDQVLHELGYDDRARSVLRESGVIAGGITV